MTREELIAEAQRRGLLSSGLRKQDMGLKVPDAAAIPNSSIIGEATDGVDRRLTKDEGSMPDKSAYVAEAQRRGLLNADTESNQPEVRSRWSAIRKGLAEGLTFGFSDELNSLMPASTISGRSADIYKQGDAETQALRKEYPGTMLLSEIAGGLPTAGVGGGVLMGAKALRGAAPIVRGLTGIGTGAIEGALSGAGHASNDARLEGAAVGAATGGLVGGAMTPVASGVRRVVDKAMSRTPEGATKVAEAFIDAQVPHGTNKFTNAMNIIKRKSAVKPKSTGAERFEATTELAQGAATVAGGGIPLAQIAKQIGKAFTGHPKMPGRAKAELDTILKTVQDNYDYNFTLTDKDGLDMLMKLVPDEARKPFRDYLKKNAGGLVFGATTPAVVGSGMRD